MLINYEEMPANSRLWVYQANRQLSEKEQLSLQDFLQQFIHTWEAHGSTLRAACQIFHRRFVVIALDESYHAPSGCAIDQSVKSLREFGAAHDLDFFDRTQILFFEGENLQTITVKELKNAVKIGRLQPDSLVLDTTVQQKKEWEIEGKPAQKTWLARYFL